MRRLGLVVAAAVAAAGCMVGPDYVRPPTPTADAWLESGDTAVHTDAEALARWWEVFGDPVLTRLVEYAAAQNLTLRAAGLRVLAAQARRGIAVGNLFPQEQEITGSYTRTHDSANAPLGFSRRDFDTYQTGFDAAWELDLWGKFRRAVEAADAELLGAIATYDDVLVSLVAEVAATYVTIRFVDERLTVARDNVRVQRDGLEIARARFESGGTSELDVQQATTLLRDTEATIPQLEIERRRAAHSLAVLAGVPPRDPVAILGETGHLPEVPIDVAVGIPADLLRRRPDVRRAEEAAAAQCARIGVSVANLLPAFEVSGSVGLNADSAAHFFEGRSFEAFGGPSFTWPVLNYGRLTNDVRLQDAAFQELVTAYQQTILTAQQEVEDALVGYVRGAERVARLTESVAAANRAVELSGIQYREGGTDFTAVLNTQQAKLHEEDLLVATRSVVVLEVIALYKALGGGWELRADRPFVPEETRAEMRARGHWRWPW